MSPSPSVLADALLPCTLLSLHHRGLEGERHLHPEGVNRRGLSPGVKLSLEPGLGPGSAIPLSEIVWLCRVHEAFLPLLESGHSQDAPIPAPLPASRPDLLGKTPVDSVIGLLSRGRLWRRMRGGCAQGGKGGDRGHCPPGSPGFQEKTMERHGVRGGAPKQPQHLPDTISSTRNVESIQTTQSSWAGGGAGGCVEAALAGDCQGGAGPEGCRSD